MPWVRCTILLCAGSNAGEFLGTMSIVIRLQKGWGSYCLKRIPTALPAVFIGNTLQMAQV
jgi:hypothetical protein